MVFLMKINVIKANGLLVVEPLNPLSKYGLDIWGAIRTATLSASQGKCTDAL